MNKPDFTPEQMTWLEEALRPPCCHVSGHHNPTHWTKGGYVCMYQKSAAYESFRAALGLDDVAGDDCVPDEHCYWCNLDKPKRTAKP